MHLPHPPPPTVPSVPLLRSKAVCKVPHILCVQWPRAVGAYGRCANGSVRQHVHGWCVPPGTGRQAVRRVGQPRRLLQRHHAPRSHVHRRSSTPDGWPAAAHGWSPAGVRPHAAVRLSLYCSMYTTGYSASFWIQSFISHSFCYSLNT